MAPLTPTNPEKVLVIRSINQWITTLSAPFSRFGRIKIGGRGTLVRLQTGGVAVFSPTALTQEVKNTVQALGEVKYIAAPDLEHHIFLGPWHQAYPNAKVIGPGGLPEKRKKQNNEEVPFAALFTKANYGSVKIDPEFDAEFDYEYVQSHPNTEIVFLHKPTKTVIQADLFFNLPATEQYSKSEESATSGILTRIWTSLNSTAGSASNQKRFLWWAISASDRKGFNASIGKIDKWDFDRVIPCHGDVIETGGKGVFQKVFAWHLEALKKEEKKDT